MGKSRVKGIVVEIGGDTVGLDKALEGTNKKIYNTQQNLKDVERLLKLDPKNTVLLEQKQKLLAEAISETEDKLDALNQASEQVAQSAKDYEQWEKTLEYLADDIAEETEALKDLREQQIKMQEAGRENTGVYRDLIKEIEFTESCIKELEDEAEEAAAELKKCATPDQFDNLQREIEATKISLRNLEKQADDTDNQINGIDEKPIAEVEDAANRAANALGDASDKASIFGDVLKAEAIVEGAKGIVSNLKDVAEETKEYRKIMGSLEVSSEAAGYTTEQTKEAYKKLYGVLADDQSAATTLANLQALGLNQEQLLDVIDNAIGGWAKYGDSIPIDGLAEAINETVKAGQVTGTFADILNWGAAEGESYGQELIDLTQLQKEYDDAVANGTKVSDWRISELQEMIGIGDVWGESVEKMADSEEKQIAKLKALLDAGEDWNSTVMGATTAEDKFNLALQQCTTESERMDLVMQAMADQGLSAAAEKWRENNASMVESNETSADLQEQMAILGEKIEPLVTKLTNLVVAALDWFNSLDSGTQNFIITTVLLVAALGPVISGFSGVSSIVQKLNGTDLAGLASTFGTITGKELPSVQTAFSSVFGFIAMHPWIAVILAAGAAIAVWGDDIQAALQKVDDFLQGVFAKDWTEVFGPVLGGVLNDFFEVVKGIWDGCKKILDGIIDFIRGVFTGDWERAWRGVVQIFEGVFQGLLSVAKLPINGVISLVNGAISGINLVISGLNKIPGVNIGTIGQIPLLANGGEVLHGSAIVGDAGPELLTVLGDRTVVQPLTNNTTNNTNHLGGVTMVVYGAPGQDVRELAHIVLDEIQGIYDSKEAALV